MKYEELVETVRSYYDIRDASMILGHFAIQFNIEGEAEGEFYVEFSDGEIDVQPYEYYDKDITLTMDADTAIDIASGDITVKDAYDLDKIKIWGEFDKTLDIYEKIFNAPTKRIYKKKESER